MSLSLLLLLVAGCGSGTSTLTIEREPATIESASTSDIVGAIGRAAIANGFFQIATADNINSHLVAYRADVKHSDGTHGTIYVQVRQPKTLTFIVEVRTSPDGDYPQARAFRSQAKAALRQLMPKATFSGF